MAASLALANASIPMFGLVTAVTMVLNDNCKAKILNTQYCSVRLINRSIIAGNFIRRNATRSDRQGGGNVLPSIWQQNEREKPWNNDAG